MKKEIDKVVKQVDEVYCSSCGNTMKQKAEICISCGVRQKNGSEKNKTTAILLAIFVGAFAWLYTWKKDYWKFWVVLVAAFTLAIPTAGFIGIGIWIWVFVDICTKPDNYYKEF